MRQAEIYRKEILAGFLIEDGGEYRFCYDEAYLTREDALPVSLTLPLQTEAFVSPVLFPFFDGLIPEGWLLDVALRNTDISILDRMSLLLYSCGKENETPLGRLSECSKDNGTGRKCSTASHCRAS